MKKLLGLAIALWFGAATAQTITNGPAGSGNSGGSTFNVLDYGAKCDGAPAGANGTSTAASTAFTQSDYTLTSADIGKTIGILGAGTNGATLTTTIAAASGANVTLATPAISNASPILNNASVAMVATAATSGSYVPGDTITLTGGTPDSANNTVLTVAQTKVYGTPTIAAAGSGGTNGTYNVTGTTGTNNGVGERFVANVTVTGGAISAVNSLVSGGRYMVNPTSLSADTVISATTGFTAPTGGQLAVTMGVYTVTITGPGVYSVSPSNPVAQGSTSGTGVGATFTMTIGAAGGWYYGTDDTTAINLTTAAARATSTSHSSQPFEIVFPKTRRCLAQSPLNFTGFINQGAQVTGGYIECATSGLPCVDAMGSRFIKWNELLIHGSQINPPNIGRQRGRTSNANAADFFVDNSMVIQGFFTFTADYVLASESNNSFGSYYRNNQLTPNTYATVLDGFNHFSASSTFVSITTSVNTLRSFNQNSYFGTTFFTLGTHETSTPVWFGGTSELEIYNSYCAGAGVYGAYLYNISTSSPENTKYNCHMETVSLTDAFFITGGSGALTPTLNGFSYSDDKAEETNSVFKLDANVKSIAISALEVQITSFFPSNGVKLFDNLALWTIGGTVKLPTIASWTEPIGFDGTVCIATLCTNYVPTLPINRNPDFVLDQVQEGASLSTATTATVVDGWNTKATGSPGTLTYQRSTSSPPAGYGYYLATAVTAAVTPTAAISQILRTTIEGPDMVSALFGTASALSITFDFCAQANNIGTYAAWLQNGAANRSYIVPYTITIASTWQCFINTIPGDTTGTWLNTQNHLGLLAGFTIGAGSNFNTTAGAWQAGTFYNTASTFNYMGTASATLNIAAVHIGIGPYHLPYQPRTFDKELLLAQHWYTKSFVLGTKPIQNGGTAGAVTFISPFAQVTSAVAGTYVSFPVEMYDNNGSTAPTMTFFSTTAATANCYDFTRTADAGAAAAVNTGSKGFGLQCTLAVGDLLGDQLQVHYTANTAF